MMGHPSTNLKDRIRRRRSTMGLCFAGLALNASLSAVSAAAHLPGANANADANAATKTSKRRRNLQVEKHVLGKGPVTFFDKPTSANPTTPGLPTDSCQFSAETSSYFQGSDASSSSSSSTTPTMAIEVPFVYEVETSAEFTPAQMNVFVLPKVEQALGGELLPLLFDECERSDGGGGGEDATTRSLALDKSNPLTDGSIVGISNSPPDVVVSSDDGAACTTIPAKPGNSCALVDGILTVYVPTDNSALASFGEGSEEKEALMDEIVSSVQDAIRETMESGALNGGGDAEESVEAVRYSRDGRYQERVVAMGTTLDGENNAVGGDDDGFPFYIVIPILVGVVFVGAVALIAATKLRDRRNDRHGEEYDSDESDDEEEEDENANNNDENDVSGYRDNPTEMAERGGKSMYDLNSVTCCMADDVLAMI